MAESAAVEYYNFYCPEQRGQLSIPDLKIPTKLLKTVKKLPYQIKINHDFTGVIDGCAEAKKGRQTTWINPLIRNCFIELHAQGHAHSVEAWDDGKLVGGLYGLALGGVFCGESMFSRATDASKICLVHLCARLLKGGFTVLDTQFTNDHLAQFGIYEIDHVVYEMLIKTEMNKPTDFVLKDVSEEELLAFYFSQRS
jgi:leucyl/phenylalanyl-tRNA--protein transferase